MHVSRRPATVLASLILGLAGAFALPASASAWVPSEAGSTLTVVGVASDTDNFTLTETGSAYRITDPTGFLDGTGAGCALVIGSSPTAVDCTKAGITQITVDLDPGNANQSIFFGGCGFSAITSTQLIGANSNDTISGPPCSLTADTIRGAAGADVLSGGPGSDTASYGDHGTNVTANIGGGGGDDGSIEDGPAGARDNINPDIENLTGGSGDDTFTGAGSANSLNGGGGDDFLNGLAGNDTLNGGTSEDTLQGGEGIDTLNGGTSDDTLKGGEGDDTLDGGDDADLLNGGAGANDLATYASRSAKVTVTLGAGSSDDGGSADGVSGERDTVRGTVENLTGGSGADVLTGSEVDNFFLGGDGADTITGLAGIDTMSYTDHAAGVTVIVDSADNDGNAADGIVNARDLVKVDVENLIGTSFVDSLKGSSIANVITGGLGADQLFGVNGNDTLKANDGVADTTLDCGGNTDTLFRDAGLDPAPVACESVN
jgi:Ca2+-binding RTX toxin-like protein